MRVEASDSSHYISEGGGWTGHSTPVVRLARPLANPGKEPLMTSQPYSQLVRYKQWADGGLCDVAARNLERLDAQDMAILLRILDHIHVVDKVFQHHLLGLPHGYLAPRSRETPDFELLSVGVKDVDDWYASYVDDLPEKDFDQPVDFVFTSGAAARMRRGEIILHVCLHGTYHRGNAGIVLQKNGIAPNNDRMTDFLEAAGHHD
jgi:uncharacterized damage-inducible protein DinB